MYILKMAVKRDRRGYRFYSWLGTAPERVFTQLGACTAGTPDRRILCHVRTPKVRRQKLPTVFSDCIDVRKPVSFVQ